MRNTTLRPKTVTALAVFGLALAGLAACSPSAAGPTTVPVDLAEYAIQPAVAEVAAGSVTFTARNIGPNDPHELVVVRTDLAGDALPTGADGRFDEAAPGVEVVGKIGELAVGAEGSATFDLPAGRYVLVCNVVEVEGDEEVEAHYAEGMHTAFTVR